MDRKIYLSKWNGKSLYCTLRMEKKGVKNSLSIWKMLQEERVIVFNDSVVVRGALVHK